LWGFNVRGRFKIIYKCIKSEVGNGCMDGKKALYSNIESPIGVIG
jgi:hypothetical protein